MSHLGRPIVYRVPQEHQTETIKGQDEGGKDIVVKGSVHHFGRTEFAGQITHSVQDGKREVHDIVIHVPGRAAPIHLQGITEGDGPGTLTLVK